MTNFVCDVCRKKFTSRESLQGHRNRTRHLEPSKALAMPVPPLADFDEVGPTETAAAPLENLLVNLRVGDVIAWRTTENPRLASFYEVTEVNGLEIKAVLTRVEVFRS